MAFLRDFDLQQVLKGDFRHSTCLTTLLLGVSVCESFDEQMLHFPLGKGREHKFLRPKISHFNFHAKNDTFRYLARKFMGGARLACTHFVEEQKIRDEV